MEFRLESNTVTVPSGSKEFSIDKVQAGLSSPFGWPLHSALVARGARAHEAAPGALEQAHLANGIV